MIADASQDGGKGHRLVQNFSGIPKFPTGHMPHEETGIHMDGAGGLAEGGLILNALAFQFS